MTENTFTYDATKNCCSVCNSTQVDIKMSKKNTPYLVNRVDKSYHRTYGSDGKLHCVQNKAEFEAMKGNTVASGTSGASPTGPTVTRGTSPGEVQATQSFYASVVESIGSLDNVSAGEQAASDQCERFTILMYPKAISYAKQIAPNGDSKDIRICAMGLMHDYAQIFSVIANHKVKTSKAIANIPDVEDPTHPDDE